jgi:hypothetical protein
MGETYVIVVSGLSILISIASIVLSVVTLKRCDRAVPEFDCSKVEGIPKVGEWLANQPANRCKHGAVVGGGYECGKCWREITDGPHAPSCALFRAKPCDCRWIQRSRGDT